MTYDRRTFLTTFGLSLSACALTTDIKPALADSAAGSSPTKTRLEEILAILSDTGIQDTPTLELTLPAVAENGAFVPITVASSLEDIERFVIYVAHNPNPLVAEIELSPTVLAFVSTQIKMAGSGEVVVLAKRGAAWLRNRRSVEVSIGGCGTG
ncbi:hypothetical protein HC024_05080 [Methylococcaceae bacterium WWC4]|nr:hypothetical protein [Methylococcaceae bacterium WWC4]